MPLITDKSRKWFIASVTLISIPALVINYIGQKEHNRAEGDAGVAFGGEKVRDSEVTLASQELLLLSQPIPGAQGYTYGGIAFGQPWNVDPSEQRERLALGKWFLAEMGRQPELFAVLKREAALNGIAPDRDRVESVITNQLRLTGENEQGFAAALRPAMASLLAVRALGETAAQAIKVTRPELQSITARGYQSLDIRAWVFDASSFGSAAGLAATTLPTAMATTLATTRGGGSELFDKYKGVLAGRPTVENPFGFGYLQPDRVQLEFLTIPNAELLRVVRAKSPSAIPTSDLAHDWDVEARVYHIDHPDEFTKEETKPNPFPINGNPTITVKTTQPYDTSKEAILAKLYLQRGATLRQQVLRKISTLMASDYKAWAEAPDKPSALGVPYNSREYLRRLSEKLQAETGVRPAVTSLGTRYLSMDELRALPEIGAAKLDGGDPMADYLIRQARPLLRSTVKNGLDPLELYQASPVFTGANDDVFLARVTDALPEQTPAESEVTEELQRDTHIMATQAAAISGAEVYGQPGGAVSGKTPRVISIPALSSVAEVPADLGLSGASKVKFVEECFDLLRGDASAVHPRAVISLPADRKVAWVELNGIKGLVQQGDSAELELRTLQEFHSINLDKFLEGYFAPQLIMERTQWKSNKSSRS